jgi:pimeloyl-ACP methyl ester carboxylesterase
MQGTITVGAAEIAFEREGTGPDVVLIHAGICDRRMWDDVWPILTERCRVTRLDLRGYGESTMPSGAFAHHDDVAAIITALDLAPAVIVGASFGGNVAVETTLQHPSLVRALVVINTLVALERPSSILAAGWGRSEDLTAAGDLDGAVEMELRLWVDGPGQPANRVPSSVRDRVRQMNRALFGRHGEHEQATEIDLVPPARDRLAEIAVPTLVILGELDVPDARETADRLIRDVPAARLLTIPDAAHLPAMERPEIVASAIVDLAAHR